MSRDSETPVVLDGNVMSVTDAIKYIWDTERVNASYQQVSDTVTAIAIGAMDDTIIDGFSIAKLTEKQSSEWKTANIESQSL